MKNLIAFGAILLVIALVSSCTAKKQIQVAPETSTSQLMTKQILVFLKKKIKANQLEEAFTEYQLKAKGPASRSQNKWIFKFQSTADQSDSILKQIQASPLVIQAEYLRTKTNE